MFALLDGNAFYCSCEQVFDVSLRGKPLVVLSNNDGCVIARTDQAKALGVKMGHPAHELRDLKSHQGLRTRSANFCLYGDLSRRVVEILRDAVPNVEPYSIDETFLDMSHVKQPLPLARELHGRIKRWVGIPNCVGIGPTKTLAKVANKIAKRGAGVLDLSDPAACSGALESLPVEDIWGVGRRWSAKLRALGITTALELRDAPPQAIMDGFGVVMQRTQRELQGLSCIALQQVEPDRQQIIVSRSFGERVDDHEMVAHAIYSFAERACIKMRARGLVCSALTISAASDPFRPALRQHFPTRTFQFTSATSDTSVVLRAVKRLMGTRFLQDGVSYKRAGIVMMDLTRPENLQSNLFAPATQGNAVLMDAMDQINMRFGRGTAGMGATGWQTRPAWGMRQSNLSPRYTTRASDLPTALC